MVCAGPISFIRYLAVASIEAKQNIAPIISKIGSVFAVIFLGSK
jgi:hypothetical protein